MSKPDYVFGIGPPKSGTHSLAKCLRSMGRKCVHIGTKSEMGELMMSNKRQSKPILDGIECDAICDWPTNRLFRDLDKCYPDSKFILTYRDPDSAALSWCRMQLNWPMPYTHTYSGFKANVQDHYNECFSYFMNRSDDFLVVQGNDDPQRNAEMIAEFIGWEGTVEPFPHEFKHGAWYRSKE